MTKLQYRAWKKDYFTSALPFAQKGDDVLIPSSSNDFTANIVEGSDYANPFIFVAGSTVVPTETAISGANLKATKPLQGGQIHPQGVTLSLGDTYTNNRLHLNPKSLSVELEKSGSVSEGTIRELRRAFAAQRFLEREAVGGTRYIEQILSFFGVRSSDARMQRAEFLGGSKQPVVVSQVLQTSETTTASPLGQPAGNAVSAGGKYIFDRTFEEHGFIIGVMTVMPRAEYMNGYPRKYMKKDRLDYYWPQFANIGEQEIKRGELAYQFIDNGGNNDPNNDTFGYTPRYAEYKFINSHVHGDFKDSLNFWTLVRDFGNSGPLLNEEFITCKPSTRIFAYERQEDDQNNFNHLWIQVGFNISALRPL